MKLKIKKKMFGSLWKLLENVESEFLYGFKANSINFRKFIIFFSNLQEKFKSNKKTTQFFFSLKQSDIIFSIKNTKVDVFGN